MTSKHLLGQNGVHWHRTGRGAECWEMPLPCSGLVMAVDDDRDGDGADDDNDNDDEYVRK